MRALEAGLAGADAARAGAAARIAAWVRVPVPASHVGYLDGWRGIAILMVLAGHYIGSSGALGIVGVELFLVLSGKLMADILIFRQMPIVPFLKRRFARIFPALAAYVLTAGLLFNFLFWTDGLPLRFESPAAALLFFHNYLALSDVLPAFEHTWSLAVEEHSYLLLVVIVALSRARPVLAAGLAIAVCAVTLFSAMWLDGQPAADTQPLSWRSDIRVRSVLISFAVCILLRPRIAQVARQLLWIVPAAAAASIAMLIAGGDLASPAMFACTLLAALAVNGLAAAPTWMRRFLESPLLLWFGTLSFSIYLWQQTFYCFVQIGLPALAGIGLTLLVSLWSFRRIEDPARSWLNARWSRAAPLEGRGVNCAVAPDTRFKMC